MRSTGSASRGVDLTLFTRHRHCSDPASPPSSAPINTAGSLNCCAQPAAGPKAQNAQVLGGEGGSIRAWAKAINDGVQAMYQAKGREAWCSRVVFNPVVPDDKVTVRKTKPALEATQGQISSQSTTDCHPILVAFVWELTEETIDLPLACLQGGELYRGVRKG